MSIKIKSNPINIAPFVDVLLVLFVILVVAARFDGPGKDEIAKLNATIELLQGKIVLLQNVPKAKKVEKIVAVPTATIETKIVTKVITEKVEDTNKIESLVSKIADLEDALAKARSQTVKMNSSGGATANIVFGLEGKISVNGQQVSEDFAYTLLKTTHPDIVIGWKGRGHETADKFKDFAKSQGYGGEQ